MLGSILGIRKGRKNDQWSLDLSRFAQEDGAGPALSPSNAFAQGPEAGPAPFSAGVRLPVATIIFQLYLGA